MAKSKYTKEEQEFIEKAIEESKTKTYIIKALGTYHKKLSEYLDNKVDITIDVVEKDKSPIVIQQVKSTEEKINTLVQNKLKEEYIRLRKDSTVRLNYLWLNDNKNFLSYFQKLGVDYYRVFGNTNFKIVSKDGINYRRGVCKLIEADNE